jgi:cytochrome c biogenesis protein CcdA
LAVFGALIVKLTGQLDAAQQAIKWLTGILVVMTGLLVLDVIWRFMNHIPN